MFFLPLNDFFSFWMIDQAEKKLAISYKVHRPCAKVKAMVTEGRNLWSRELGLPGKRDLIYSQYFKPSIQLLLHIFQFTYLYIFLQFQSCL